MGVAQVPGVVAAFGKMNDRGDDTFGDLSPAQERALNAFREQVDRIPNKPSSSDDYYLKWLRARNFDLDAALAMFRDHIEWRKKWNVDAIFDWQPPEVLDKYTPGVYFGEDRKGNPVFYDFLGNVDIKGLYRSAKSEDLIKYKVLQAEQGNRLFEELSERHGRCIGTITVVSNMENLSYQRQYHWQALQIIRKMFTLYANNYPERTEAIFVIKAPRIFPLAYNLVKPFMDEATKQRLYILGDDYKEVLLKHIAPDQLPAVYGGERMEPDPECTGVLNWGGMVPERYYLTNLTNARKETMNKVTVRRSTTHEHRIEIKTAGCIIRWEFLTEDYDIGFKLVLESTPEPTIIVKKDRCESHVVPEEGMHHCDQPGIYVLIFDNSHSWMRSKELYYFVDYQEPGSNEGLDSVADDLQTLLAVSSSGSSSGIQQDSST